MYSTMLIVATISITTMLVSAVITSSIADSKGYDRAAFILLGLFLPVIGIIVAAVMPEKDASRHDSVSDADELRKFRSLLDDGIISQDEYDRKKREILG